MLLTRLAGASQEELNEIVADVLAKFPPDGSARELPSPIP